jgi:DNA-binding GntR family transcriptional regulator
MTDPPLLRGFAELASEAGLRAEQRVLHRLIRPATIDEAELFSVAPGVDVFELHRQSKLEGLPISVSEAVIPLNFAPELAGINFNEPGVSLLQAVERSVGISHAKVFLDAIPAEPKVAEWLELRAGEPVLRTHERIYDFRDRLIQQTDTLARGDRVRYKTVAFRRIPSSLDPDGFDDRPEGQQPAVSDEAAGGRDSDRPAEA